jgi:hypothetical protein
LQSSATGEALALGAGETAGAVSLGLGLPAAAGGPDWQALRKTIAAT